MNVFIAGIGKIVIVEALAGLVLASFFFERTRRHARWFGLAFGLVAAASVVGYFNFGHFRHGWGLVHVHEQFHFYLGSKYLHEIRYDAIYRAAVVAAAEQGVDVGRLRIRDPMTFEVVLAQTALDSAEAIKARFTPERWQAFRADLTGFLSELRLYPDPIWTDHGNTGSPAWAAVASVFTSLVGVSRLGAGGLALLDVALLAGLFLAVARCFSGRVATIGLVFAMAAPRAYDWLGGSILRLDWLFALGLCACFLKVRRWKTAGAFLGYAVASKPFCAVVALGLGARMAISLVRRRRLRREHTALVLAAVATLLASVVVSAAVFGGFDIWLDYADRILVTIHEKYYDSNYSFRDVFLQVRHFGVGELLDWTPEPVAASLPEVSASDYPWAFWLAKLTLGGLLVFAIARHDEVFALGIGTLLVFVGLVTNIYYWQLLALPAVAWADGYREDVRRLLNLLSACLLLMAAHLFVHYNAIRHLQGYFGSYWLCLLCLVVIGVEATSLDPVRRRLGAPLGHLVARFEGDGG